MSQASGMHSSQEQGIGIVSLPVQPTNGFLLVSVGLASLQEWTGHGESSMKANENRDRLLAIITLHPGLGIREAARRLGLPLGSLKYHADYLEMHGILHKAKFQGRQLLFPYQAPQGKELAEIILLRDPHLLQVHRWLQANGPVAQRGILNAIEAPRSSVQHRLDRLAAGGLVRSQFIGRERVYEVI